LQEWLTKPIEETYNDRFFDGVLKKLSEATLKGLYDANRASQRQHVHGQCPLGLASLIDRRAV
jgi:hypothetical protein